MTTFSARPGFALPVVLFISLLGIFLGFGRLLVFHNQCRLRIDRQQEYEKVFAVRSALNRLQNGTTRTLSLPVEGAEESIVMCTDSSRKVKVLTHPADAIFPISDNPEHFFVGREKANALGKVERFYQIDGTSYRYGSSVSGDKALRTGALERVLTGDYHVCLMPTNAVAGDKCRLSLDMTGTGRWSDDPFGRRYAFNVYAFCGTNEHDQVYFILRRKRANEIFGGTVGFLDKLDESWRPRQDGESVIYAVLETSEFGARSFTAWTQSYDKGKLQDPVPCAPMGSSSGFDQAQLAVLQSGKGFGIQLVGRNLTLFQASAVGTTISKRHDLFGTAQIPDLVYQNFTNDMKTVGAEAPTLSTDMVMELEIRAGSWREYAQGTVDAPNKFNRLEVFPAYEFEIRIENWNERMREDVLIEPKLATVVHLEFDRAQSESAPCRAAIAYDTHGTEIKGWRTGERKAWGLLR